MFRCLVSLLALWTDAWKIIETVLERRSSDSPTERLHRPIVRTTYHILTDFPRRLRAEWGGGRTTACFDNYSSLHCREMHVYFYFLVAVGCAVFPSATGILGIPLFQHCTWTEIPHSMRADFLDLACSEHNHTDPSTLAECKTRCESTAGCRGIDYLELLNLCVYFTSSGGIEASEPVTHYEYRCPGQLGTSLG